MFDYAWMFSLTLRGFSADHLRLNCQQSFFLADFTERDFSIIYQIGKEYTILENPSRIQCYCASKNLHFPIFNKDFKNRRNHKLARTHDGNVSVFVR